MPAIKSQSRDWKSSFDRWGLPPSQAEEERCKNAESMIRKAIQASPQLQSRDVSVFTHGSYANRTNVRSNSDVDVAVACSSLFYFDLPEGVDRSDYGIEPSNYSYTEFKNDVGSALTSYFGSSAVTRGGKAFDIKATSYHVEADVAPFVDYRQYFGRYNHRDGYVLFPDRGGRIENYPRQHYENGVTKNNNTNQRFKKIARVLKGVCYEMQDNGSAEAHKVSGFLLECLAGLTPNPQYSYSDLIVSTRNVVRWLFINTQADSDCSEWTELNNIKYLFHSSQPWTKQAANEFLLAMWRYVGFTND